MGVISIAKRIKAPFQNIARGMTQQHAAVASHLGVTRRNFLAGGIALGSIVVRRPTPQQPAIWFPEEIGENDLSSYPCDPNADELYSDAYRVLQPNPVVITANAIQIAQENRKRKEMFLVNVGTAAILIAFGFFPTTTVYTLPLQACATANDGTGGIIIDQAWRGTVFAILAANQSSNGSLLFTELPE